MFSAILVSLCVLSTSLIRTSSASTLFDSTDTKSSSQVHTPGAVSQQAMTMERQLVNRALSRILDMTYEMFRELGASQGELKELTHKRSVIQACYFQAISCY